MQPLPKVARKCYGCNASFEAAEGSTTQLCEACQKREAAAPRVALPTEDARPGVLSAFLFGLSAGPVGMVVVWILRALWDVNPGIILVGFIVMMVIGRVIEPFYRKRYEPLPQRLATFAGSAISLFVTSVLAWWLKHH